MRVSVRALIRSALIIDPWALMPIFPAPPGPVLRGKEEKRIQVGEAREQSSRQERVGPLACLVYLAYWEVRKVSPWAWGQGDGSKSRQEVDPRACAATGRSLCFVLSVCWEGSKALPRELTPRPPRS